MRIGVAILSACLVAGHEVTAGQTRRPGPTPTPTVEPAQLKCPAPLGTGVASKRSFCDVMVGRDPATGIIIAIPPHKGDVTLTFDLHNRHTFSDEQAKDPRAAFARYTTSVGALTLDNTLISRAAIQSEFRTPKDFVDRIGGGAGASGLKAVGPTGTESISLTIPESENEVSILGEKLLVERADGRSNYTSVGRPIAVISNVMVQYFPPPPARVTPPKRSAKTPAVPPAKAPARPKR